LTVIHNNEIYKAKATKIKSSKITSIVQGEKTLFSGEEVELKISFKDDEAMKNHYLINVDPTITFQLKTAILMDRIIIFLIFMKMKILNFQKL